LLGKFLVSVSVAERPVPSNRVLFQQQLLPGSYFKRRGGIDRGRLAYRRVVQRGDTIQVSADLTNVQDNTDIWGEQYERKASHILSLQQQIVSRENATLLTRARESARSVSKKWRLSRCERAAPCLQGAIDRALLPDCVVTHLVARQYICIENVKPPTLCP